MHHDFGGEIEKPEAILRSESLRWGSSSHIACARLVSSSIVSIENNALQLNLKWTYIHSNQGISYFILSLLETALHDPMAPFPLHRSHLILISIFITLITSLPHSSAAATCSELYGHPDQQVCRQMLFGNNGIPHDTNSRLYSLRLRRRPRNVSVMQWRQKQLLPILRSNGACLI